MSNTITKEEKDKLFTQIFHLLGMPVRGVELTEDQMDSFLEMSISEYEQHVNDWLIESQWSSLIGLDIDTQSLTRAFTTRSLDYETQFTYAYSKIVGLQAGGDWELKKDFVELVAGQQMYTIPAGREVNEILWYARPELNDSMMDPFFGFGGGFGGGGVGMGQVGGNGSYFMTPAFDMIMRMQDRSLKNRLIGGDLTYRITAGPNGTKLLHLYNTPGGKYDFTNLSRNHRVWYWYYETTSENRDECLDANKDIIKLPSDIEIEPLTWGDLNKPSQNWVRKYLISFAKEGLARIWGKFSGDLNIPDNPVKLDYVTLLTEARDERSKLIEELNQKLERLRPEKILERKGNEAENLNKSLKYRAFIAPIITI